MLAFSRAPYPPTSAVSPVSVLKIVVLPDPAKPTSPTFMIHPLIRGLRVAPGLIVCLNLDLLSSNLPRPSAQVSEARVAQEGSERCPSMSLLPEGGRGDHLSE